MCQLLAAGRWGGCGGGSAIVYCVRVQTPVISEPTSQYRQIATLFLQSSEIGTQHPLTRRRVCPPLGSGGRGTLAGEGVGVRHNSDEGTALWYSRYICT